MIILQGKLFSKKFLLQITKHITSQKVCFWFCYSSNVWSVVHKKWKYTVTDLDDLNARPFHGFCPEDLRYLTIQ